MQAHQLDNPIITKTQYLEYEFQAQLSPGVLALFNDAAETFENQAAIQVGDKMLRISLIDGEPTKTIVMENQVMYPDAFEGVDIYYTLSGGTIKEDIVINTAAAAHEFSFALEQQNVLNQLQDDDSIIYTDTEGHKLWTIESPTATDANGQTVETYLHYDGNTYTVGAIPAENTAYPIYLDPTVTTSLSSSIWYKNYAGAASTTSLGPYRFDLGRLQYDDIIKQVNITLVRKVKNPAAAIVSYYDNSNDLVKAWYQWLDKNGNALTEKADIVCNASSLAIFNPPSNARYIEFTGTCNAAQLTDGLYQGYAQAYFSTIYYDDSTSCCWRFTDASVPSLNDILSYKLTPATYAGMADGSVFSQSLYAYPGKTFTAGARTFNVYTSSMTSPRFENCFVNQYDATGTLLGSTALAAAAGAFRSTSVNILAAAYRLEMTGTYRSGTGTIVSNINAVLMIPAATNSAVTVLAPDKDITNDRVAVWQNMDSTLPTIISVSVNDQEHYQAGNRVTCKAGDLVYVTVTKQAGDTKTPKIGSVSIITILDTVAANISLLTKRVIAVADTIKSDTSRKTIAEAIVNAITKRVLATADIIKYSTSRGIVAAAISLTDTLRTIAISVTPFIDTLRSILASTQPTKPKNWPHVKQMFMEAIIHKKKVRITNFKD